MSSNANGNKGQKKLNKYSHEDVIAEGASKDVEFQRAITTIEALQSSKGSYIIAKGALDKADAAFLIEEDAKRKHSERVMEERERRAFLEARKLALEKEEAEIEGLMSVGTNEANTKWRRVGVQGEQKKTKKKMVHTVHRVKKRRLKGGHDDLEREDEDEKHMAENQVEENRCGGTGNGVETHVDEEKGTELQSLLGGYGSSSLEENDDDDDDGGGGDDVNDRNKIKLPSARDLI